MVFVSIAIAIDVMLLTAAVLSFQTAYALRGGMFGTAWAFAGLGLIVWLAGDLAHIENGLASLAAAASFCVSAGAASVAVAKLHRRKE
jgi:hypothetical protein